MSDDMIEYISDILVDDHVSILLENSKLREKVKKLEEENKLMRTALDNRRIRPLTDDQLHALSRVHWNHQSNQLDYIKFARAIEEIHNIGKF